MTRRLPVAPAPAPLEAYIHQFDEYFGSRAQRASVRRYLEGLLLPAERNKTLTALANTEPVVGAQHREAQRLQWFLSEAGWSWEALAQRRVELLQEVPATAAHGQGVLVIDEHGDRKWGTKTAHVGRQYLANLGKVDNGVVSVSSLWADERVYYPVAVEPYTPAHHFAGGRQDVGFRTKLAIAAELVAQAVASALPFRAVVADSFYGEDDPFKQALRSLEAGYVLALRPSHAWWHPVGAIGSLGEAAETAGWVEADEPGTWVAVERPFRDGHRETWWALEVETGPYGLERPQRALVVTTDPATLPDLATWYLVTNLPAPETARAQLSPHAPADLAEIVRLYGLRMWVEQSYKQVKHTLGWSDYQVRSDRAIRRHWELVCCAFAFCWWADGRLPGEPEPAAAGGGKKVACRQLAADATGGACLAGTVDTALALLARLFPTATAAGTPEAAGAPVCRTRTRPLCPLTTNYRYTLSR
jgi:SRSO17 transposase